MNHLLSEVAWKTVPALLLLFLCTGYPYAILHLLPYLGQHYNPKSDVVLWLLQFHASLIALLYCFYLVAFGNADLGRTPREVPAKGNKLTVASLGLPRACTKGGSAEVFCPICQRYQPLRARHCKRHNRCSVGFDHCCPWFDACIHLYTIKPFVAFVGLAPALLLPPVYFLAPLVRSHFRQIVPYWGSERLYELWWRRKRSWAVGPVYRYVGGLVHCVWQWQEQHEYVDVSSPHVMATVYLLLCGLVSCVGVAMLVITLRQLAKNQLTPEIERSKRWKTYQAALRDGVKPSREWDQHRYIWVSTAGCERNVTAGEIRYLDPSVDELYNLGPEANLAMFLGESWMDFWHWSKPPPAAPGYYWCMNGDAYAALPRVPFPQKKRRSSDTSCQT